MKFRFAVTALSLTACVLLITLWVRSCNTSDTLLGRISDERAFDIQSSQGVIILVVQTTDDGKWGILSIADPPEMESYKESRWRAGTTTSPGWYVVAPHWFFVAAFAILGIAFWCPCRFSLRTLLIATTLVAVVLGTVVAFS